MYGVFIVDLDKLGDPDWKTLPLSALESSELWFQVGLHVLYVRPEDREKVVEAVMEIQEESGQAKSKEP